MKRALLSLIAASLVLVVYSTQPLAGTSQQLDRRGGGPVIVVPPPAPAPGTGDGNGNGCEGDADGLAGLRNGERFGSGGPAGAYRAPARTVIPWRMLWNVWIRLRIG